MTKARGLGHNIQAVALGAGATATGAAAAAAGGAGAGGEEHGEAEEDGMGVCDGDSIFEIGSDKDDDDLSDPLEVTTGVGGTPQPSQPSGAPCTGATPSPPLAPEA